MPAALQIPGVRPLPRRRLPRFSRGVLTLTLFAFAAVVSAQTPSVSLLFRGKVLDPEGAVVPGAEIRISGPGIPLRTAASDMAGEFSLSLEPGRYSITIRAEGFQESTFPLVIEGAPAIREYVLPVAARRDSIEVRGEVSEEVATIASATKTPVAFRDVPQAVSIFPKELIQDRALAGIAEVVQHLPGVVLAQGEGNRDQIVMRGNNTTADFYLNGIRDDVQYYRDLYDVERVEALKGPNALIFGRGGAGGVINRVTKEAGFTPLHEFTIQGGAYSNRRVTADLGRPLNPTTALRLNGMYENSDSYRRFVGVERFGISPALTLTPSGRTKLKLGYEYFRDRRVADRGIPSFQGRPVETSRATFFGNPEESSVRAGVHLGIVSLEHRRSQMDIRNNTLVGDYDKFYQNFVPGAVNAAGTHAALTAYNTATKRRNIFNQTDMNYYATTGAVRHILLAGGELGLQLTDNVRNTGYFHDAATSILVPLRNPVIDAPVTFRQSASDADNHVRARIAATYVQDQIELNQHLQVVAGLRFEQFHITLHDKRAAADFTRSDNMIAPRLGIIVKPATPLSLYFSYSVSYLPSSGDQFAALNSVAETLKPERFNNYEGGVKWDVRRTLSLTMAVYRLDRLNSRANDPNDPARVVQTGSQRTNGVEISVDGRVAAGWRIYGGYAWQDAFVSSATSSAPQGARVPLVPQHTLSLWNSYRFHPRWEVGLGIVNRSEMFAGIDNTVSLPGYTRADAALFFTLTEGARLQVNIENLFDADYFLTAHNNNNIQPGSPRAARVGLTMRF